MSCIQKCFSNCFCWAPKEKIPSISQASTTLEETEKSVSSTIPPSATLEVTAKVAHQNLDQNYPIGENYNVPSYPSLEVSNSSRDNSPSEKQLNQVFQDSIRNV